MKKTCFIVLILFIIMVAYNSLAKEKERKMIGEVKYSFEAKINDIYIVDVYKDKSPLTFFYYEKDKIKSQRDKIWIIVGFNANWAVDMTILETKGGKKIFEAGQNIVLVIHSPSQTFAKPREEIKGEEISLDLYAKKYNDNTIEFYLLQVH